MSELEYSEASVMALIQTPLYHIWSDVKTRKIALFLLINTSFMVVEFVFGFLSNSLGLISDACHMLFDCAALAIGLYASYVARLPANSSFPFGYGRFEVLSGYANAVFLILVAALIVVESLERLLEPPEISTGSLLIVSVGGLVVNVIGLIFFHEAHHHAHGSGPCTHGHAHHDTLLAIPTPRTSIEADEAEVSLLSHNSSLVPQVAHSHHGHSSSHHHSLDSPILNLQGTAQSRVETHSGNMSFSDCERNETGTRGPYETALSHDGTSGLQDQAGVSLHSRNHEKNQDDSSGSDVADILQGLKDTPNHRHDSVLHGENKRAAQQGTNLTTAHVPASFSHEHHHSVSSAEEGLTGKAAAHFLSKPHNHQRGFSSESLQRDTLTPETGSPSHSQPGIQAVNKRPVLTRSSSAFENQMILIQSQHLPHTNNVTGDSHEYGHLAQQQGQNLDQQHEHGLHTHSALRHQQVVMNCEDHHDHSDSDTDFHGHGHSHNSQEHGHSGDHHGCNHGEIATAGVDTIHLRQLVHLSGEHHSGYEIDLRTHENDKSDVVGHTGNHSLHHGGEACAHDHGHEHGEHDRDHDDHGDSHGDNDDHSDHQHIDHNMQGIFLHILADTLGSVGVVISTLLIKYKGWLFTDPACSIFISVLIVSSVVPLVRNSAELLLQRVPRSAKKRIEKALKKVEEVDGVHDWHKLQVWSYTSTELVGTLRLHASVRADKQFVRGRVTRILEAAGISDLTLEVEDIEQKDE